MVTTAPDLLIAGGYVPELGLDPSADATRREGRPTAVAVSGSRIAAVGGEELRGLAGPGTRVVEAAGGAILPGINDGHLHLCASAISAHVFTDLAPAGDWTGVARLLEAAHPGPEGWIRAHGWDEARLGPGGADAVFAARPDVPLVAFDQTGHQLLLNAPAVRRAGLEGRTGSSGGGVVGAFANGAPNGHLTDGAMALATRVLPDVPAATVREALLAHQRRLHAWGVTSLTEPGLGPGGTSLLGGTCGTSSLEALVDLAATGELALRTTVLLLFSGTGGATAEDTRRGLAGGLATLAADRGIDPLLLRIAGVKVFADGTPRSGTAWMSEPYETPCGHGHGHLVVAGDDDAARVAELREIVAAVHAAGLQVGVHATGDAATAAAVDAVVEAQRDGRTDARHYIIHGSFADRPALRHLAEHGIGYSTNPAIRAAAGALMRRVLGPGRFGRHQPLASALAEGLIPNIASDAPVTTADWRSTVAAAVSRDTTAGPGEDDAERVSLAQALALMTRTPAWQDHADTHKGRVLPGQLADLCVLAGPLPVDPHALHDLPTALTVVGGQVVHEAASVPVAQNVRPA